MGRTEHPSGSAQLPRPPWSALQRSAVPPQLRQALLQEPPLQASLFPQVHQKLEMQIAALDFQFHQGLHPMRPLLQHHLWQMTDYLMAPVSPDSLQRLDLAQCQQMSTHLHRLAQEHLDHLDWRPSFARAQQAAQPRKSLGYDILGLHHHDTRLQHPRPMFEVHPSAWANSGMTQLAQQDFDFEHPLLAQVARPLVGAASLFGYFPRTSRSQHH
mmetsp:Transcript_30660/g.49344  ORF Transcript_30660/g.49344 Transcript_30660/m.49344 type:complete len:214 (-) Transcript_30660:429-1070(-)